MERRGFIGSLAAGIAGYGAARAVEPALRPLSGPENPGPIQLFYCGDHFEAVGEGGDFPDYFRNHFEADAQGYGQVRQAIPMAFHGDDRDDRWWGNLLVSLGAWNEVPFKNRREAEDWLIAQTGRRV